MKKILMIGLIVALALIIVGGAGVVYAHARGIDGSNVVAFNRSLNGDNVVRQFSYGPGGMMQGYGSGYGPGRMMQGYGPGGMMQGYGSGGMMGGRGFGGVQGEGPMHDYMISAFAEVVGLTAEEAETRLEAGETLKEIAIAQGITVENLPELVTQVRQAALDQAVADEVITQAQADLMLEHMNNYQGPGFGPGYGHEDCPMWDGDALP